MATKENMTSQRGMLKSIQSKMNTLASILFDSLKSVFLGGKSLCASPLSPSPGQIAVGSESRSRPYNGAHFLGLLCEAGLSPCGKSTQRLAHHMFSVNVSNNM